MGCIVSVISHVLQISEKISICFSCAALVSCIMVTITLTLCMGIGIGYNYCYVDFKTKHRYVPARYKWYRYNPTPHWKRSVRDNAYDYISEDADEIQTTEINAASITTTENYVTNDTNPLTQNEKTNSSKVYDLIVNEILKENAKHNNLSNTIELNENESSKLLIPISGLDLISLLSKWRAENRNYSLQIVVS
ncbi:uncharacterized protein LOC119830973 [Zerene cesonia]|uniref:uncharacterized protein LOC119830973 n=1 Tax=Zerene cesonia TaxID=33412 RepID=UPI0018E54D02|nr:uncharacterized protein LOC119830973 [Zerene cesonia]